MVPLSCEAIGNPDAVKGRPANVLLRLGYALSLIAVLYLALGPNLHLDQGFEGAASSDCMNADGASHHTDGDGDRPCPHMDCLYQLDVAVRPANGPSWLGRVAAGYSMAAAVYPQGGFAFEPPPPKPLSS